MSFIRTMELDPDCLEGIFICLEKRQTSRLSFGKGLIYKQKSNEITTPKFVDCEQNDLLSMKFRLRSKCHICFVKVVAVNEHNIKLSVPNKTYVLPRRFFSRCPCHYEARIDSRKMLVTDISLGGCQIELASESRFHEDQCYDIMLNNNRLTGRLNTIENTKLGFQFAIDDSLNPGLFAMVYKINKIQNKGRRFAKV